MKYTFQQFKKEYPNDDACLDAILLMRYGSEPVCPGCGVVPAKLHKMSERRAYACQDCGHHVYPCVGTPFEKSSTKLTLWFHAMYLMTATRNGVSAKELERQLGVTYKTAWRIGHELRKLMGAPATDEPLSGHVELDEAYVGGKEKNKHASKKQGRSGGGPTGKTTVFGMLERGGDVRAHVVPNASGSTLLPIIAANVEPGSVISTDEYGTYKTSKTRLPAWHRGSQIRPVRLRDSSHEQLGRLLVALQARHPEHARPHLAAARAEVRGRVRVPLQPAERPGEDV